METSQQPKHTPEPWSAHAHIVFAKNQQGYLETNVSFCTRLDANGSFMLEIPQAEAEANAARIVQCVNALAGIELPTKDGMLSKQNAHIFIGRKVFIYSDLTLRWRSSVLDLRQVAEFCSDMPDVSKISLNHPHKL